MIGETIIGGSIATFLYLLIKDMNPRYNDKDKIQHTFNNLNYKVKDQLPQLIKTNSTDNSTTYTYSVPFGLVDDEKLNVLEKVLNKPVKISFTNQKLHIKVYKEKLPDRIDYDWNKTESWTVPIGRTHEEMVYHDFDEIPHMTIAGMTRQGKTVLLKLIFAHLINNHPNDVEFHIIDLKGGLEFNKYRKYKQVKSISSDVNDAYKALSDVLSDIKREMNNFKQNDYTNILDTPITTRKVIIVDEAAELTPAPHLSKEEKKSYQYCQYALAEIARIAGALGYRLIFATQYPTADTLPRQIKQNSDAKISFRLPTEIASRVAIDEQGAERLNNVGRAIYRTHEKYVLQVPYITDNDIKKHLKEHEVDVGSTGEKTTTRRTNLDEFR